MKLTMTAVFSPRGGKPTTIDFYYGRGRTFWVGAAAIARALGYDRDNLRRVFNRNQAIFDAVTINEKVACDNPTGFANTRLLSLEGAQLAAVCLCERPQRSLDFILWLDKIAQAQRGPKITHLRRGRWPRGGIDA